MENTSDSPKPDDKTEEIDPPKRVQQVVVGEIIRRKKPMGKRFKETFLGGSAKTTMSYVFLDILIPAAKDTLADAVSMGVEKMIFGEARSSSRRTGRRPGMGDNYTNYSRYAESGLRNRDRDRNRDDGRGLSRRARATFDFDEIIMATRPEAEQVIDRLFDIITKYGTASVKDFFEMVGERVEYTDDKWGWTDQTFRGASWTRVRKGYLLDLPKPEALD